VELFGEVANSCIDVTRYSFVCPCRFKTYWNPIGEEIELGFAGVEYVANKNIFCTIHLVSLNSCLWGMSHHHSSSSSCWNSWGQLSCTGSHIRGSKDMGLTPICKVARTSRNNGRQFWDCPKYKVRLMCLKKFIVIWPSYRLIRQNLCFDNFVFNNRMLLLVMWCGVTTSSGVMKNYMMKEIVL